MKINLNFAFTRRLDRKAFLIAKLAYICLNIYESLSSYLTYGQNRIQDFDKIEYLLFKNKTINMISVKLNIEDAIYVKYRQFEADLFSIIKNALVNINKVFLKFL
jgi:hypothetical protein